MKENKDLDLNEKIKVIIQHLLELDLDWDDELPDEYQIFNLPLITEEERQRIMQGIDDYLEKLPTKKDLLPSLYFLDLLAFFVINKS